MTTPDGLQQWLKHEADRHACSIAQNDPVIKEHIAQLRHWAQTLAAPPVAIAHETTPASWDEYAMSAAKELWAWTVQRGLEAHRYTQTVNHLHVALVDAMRFATPIAHEAVDFENVVLHDALNLLVDVICIYPDMSKESAIYDEIRKFLAKQNFFPPPGTHRRDVLATPHRER